MGGKRESIQQVARQTAARDVRLNDDIYALSQRVVGGGVAIGAGLYTLVDLVAGVYNATQTAGRIVLQCNCAAGAITVNLPTLAANTAEFVIKKMDASANTVTVDGAGAETIDGGATAVLLAQYAAIDLIAGSSTNWSVI